MSNYHTSDTFSIYIYMKCVFVGKEVNLLESERTIKRGEIYYADLPDEEVGSVQAGVRPVLITQCNRLNRNSSTVLVAMVTSKLKKPNDEVHVVLPMMKGLPRRSMVMAELERFVSAVVSLTT